MGNVEGSTSWVEAWVNSHGDRITQFAYTYTHDWGAAQDIAQETFLRLYRSRTHLQRTTFSPRWLYRVAHRLCIDWNRRRHGEHLLRDPADVGTSSQRDRPDRLAVQELLDRLPPRDRECLWLLYYEDMSIAEIARRMRMNPAAVRTRLRRARNRFRTMWKEDTHGATL